MTPKDNFNGKETQSSKKAGEDDMLVIGRRTFSTFLLTLTITFILRYLLGDAGWVSCT
jgi:hypothetical protein